MNRHHVIPDPPRGAGNITLPAGGVGIATPTPNGSEGTIANTTTQAMHGLSGAALAALIALILVIAIAGLLLLSREEQAPRRGVPLARSGGLGFLSGPYTYAGLRARARRLFISLRSRAEQVTGVRAISWTARELEKALAPGAGFHVLYDRVMYSRREPSTADVEELEDRAKRLIGGETS